jgi:hypothetical protein
MRKTAITTVVGICPWFEPCAPRLSPWVSNRCIEFGDHFTHNGWRDSWLGQVIAGEYSTEILISKIMAFRNVTLYSLVHGCCCFKGLYYLHLGCVVQFPHFRFTYWPEFLMHISWLKLLQTLHHLNALKINTAKISSEPNGKSWAGRAGRLRDRSSSLGGSKNFHFSVTRPSLRPTQPRIQWVPRTLFAGLKRPELKMTTHLHLVPR